MLSESAAARSRKAEDPDNLRVRLFLVSHRALPDLQRMKLLLKRLADLGYTVEVKPLAA
jgi:hypothetical protein